MAKKNESRPRSKSAGEASSQKAGAPAATGSQDGLRETVESIVIAFVLAFLFRTFEAEAFVIPTGSMAPTLMGQHKDTACNKCGFPFRVSASQEEPPEYITDPIQRAAWPAKNRVMAFMCPNCRYQMRFGEDAPDGPQPPPSYKGDRILVGKLSYEIGDPQRWDVAVFKYPESAKVNFIKRVAGVPNETVVISHGDILTASEDLADKTAHPQIAEELRSSGSAVFDAREIASLRQNGALSIARKPPAKVQAILQTVYDNNYALPEPWVSIFPPRWSPEPDGSKDGWQSLDGGKAFQCDGKQDEDRWLVYQHRVPAPGDWSQAIQAQTAGGSVTVGRKLVTDFYAYNTGVSAYRMPSSIPADRFFAPDSADQNWVGDLSLGCRLQTESDEGEAILSLVEGGCIFACRINLADGQATFSISRDPSFKATAQTVVRGAGSHRVEFANVDDELFLWVDGKVVEFDGRYGPLNNHVPAGEDLMPARIGSHGASIQASDLVLRRDVYYTYANQSYDSGPSAFGSANFFANPHEWGEFERLPGEAFVLRSDEYLMLGDNSPQSKDSRLWTGSDEEGRDEYYVRRDLMIGKALYIYWPHALDHLPATNIWFPYFPNFGQMGFVR